MVTKPLLSMCVCGYMHTDLVLDQWLLLLLWPNPNKTFKGKTGYLGSWVSGLIPRGQGRQKTPCRLPLETLCSHHHGDPVLGWHSPFPFSFISSSQAHQCHHPHSGLASCLSNRAWEHSQEQLQLQCPSALGISEASELTELTTGAVLLVCENIPVAMYLGYGSSTIPISPNG